MTTPAIYVYVGCYTNRASVGIHAYRTTPGGAALDPIDVVDGIPQASFLAPHPSGEKLYAVSETGSASGGGRVASFEVTAEGALTMADEVPSHGDHPCHLSVTPDGRRLQVANYSSGTVAVYELGSEGRFGDLLGILRLRGSGPTPRQTGPHAHCVVVDPTGRWLYTADLGADRIVQSTAAGERLSEFVMPAGCGPRHLRFHPTEPLLFAVGELDNTLMMLSYHHCDGSLAPVVTVSTLPQEWSGPSLAADLHVHGSGRSVYVSNRGHDSIAAYALDAEAPSLESLGWTAAGGRTPRGFGLHPSGETMLVAHQDDDALAMFDLDQTGGLPVPVEQRWQLSEPVCVAYVERPR